MEAAGWHNSPAGRRASRRMDLAERLASALVGRPVILAEDEERWDLLDQATGAPIVQVGGHLHLVEPGGLVGPQLAPERAGRYAALLLRAAAADNHFVGELDGGEEGAYVGGMAGFMASVMVDPNWSEAKRRRSRAKGKARMKLVLSGLSKAERAMRAKNHPGALTLKMDTYTVPALPPTMEITAQLAFVNAAWRRFSKLEAFSRTNKAGIKAVELRCLVGDGGAHIHFVNLSRFKHGFKKTDTRKPWHLRWKKALDATADEAGLVLDYGAVGLPFCDSRQLVKGKGRSEDEVLEDALDEGVKYITDLDEILDQAGEITGAQLLAICDVARWPRMFELMGECREAPRPEGPRLDTSCISVQEGRLVLEDDLWLQAQEPGERSLFESLLLRTALEAGQVREMKWTKAERMAFLRKFQEKPPTWRDLMDQLPLHEWLHRMMGKARCAIRYRLGQVAGRNPSCHLVDMTGRVRLHQVAELGMA